MYVAINQKQKKCAVIKHKTALSELIGCNRQTILRHQNLYLWSFGDWDIYTPTTVKIKAKNRGKNL